MAEEFDMEAMNRQVTEEFRANDGKVGGMFEGANLLILHTTGRKSGKKHDNPLAYREEDGRKFIFASLAGAPRSPGWYYNLKDNPQIEVEIGSQTVQAEAKILDEPERSEIYARQAADVPQFADYEPSAGDRTIPVVESVQK